MLYHWFSFSIEGQLFHHCEAFFSLQDPTVGLGEVTGTVVFPEHGYRHTVHLLRVSRDPTICHIILGKYSSTTCVSIVVLAHHISGSSIRCVFTILLFRDSCNFFMDVTLLKKIICEL